MKITWEQLYSDSKWLAAQLALLPRFDGILAIARGGLIPAAIVANQLGIEYVDTLGLRSYEGMKRGPVNVIKRVSPDTRAIARLLVIDDLVDTGSSMLFMRKEISHAHYAAVYAKPLGRSAADTVAREVAQDVWLHFPWELSK